MEYADCLQKSSGSGSGVEWSGLEYADCFKRVVLVVEWSMQTVYRRMVSEWSGLEYADCLQKIGSEVEWTGVCRRFTEEW